MWSTGEEERLHCTQCCEEVLRESPKEKTCAECKAAFCQSQTAPSSDQNGASHLRTERETTDQRSSRTAEDGATSEKESPKCTTTACEYCY